MTQLSKAVKVNEETYKMLKIIAAQEGMKMYKVVEALAQQYFDQFASTK